MAKKRTLVPFYGKGSQELAAAAARAFKAGDKDHAHRLAVKSDEIRLKRKARAQA